MTNMKKQILLVVLLCVFSGAAFAQGNAFSFQGRLNDGANPANGRYDLQFKLFDAALGGTQIGPTVERPSTTLINGVFSVTLDFGAQAFLNPNSIFIEIAVKPFGSQNVLTILGPRQQLTVVPFASRAQNATNADDSQNSARLGGVAAGEYITRTGGGTDFIRNSTTTQTNSNFNISGAGVINGNLTVGGTQLVAGNQVVTGSSSVASLFSGSDVRQPRGSNGLAKAMLYVQANGTISYCYNGVTGVSSGGCGFTVVRELAGRYTIDFGFNVSDRFYSATPQVGGSITRIGIMFFRGAALGEPQPNKIYIETFFTNVSNDLDAKVDNPFMLIIY
jgi:hypothetical protein